MRRISHLSVAVIASSIALGSCREEAKVDKATGLNPQAMPSMVTHNVSTLVSDSGITQYKIVAPVWYVFDETDTPCWKFPEGLYLQKFDSDFNVIATVAADSAKFFTMQKLWRLDGNVEMTKEPAELFLSPRLFWDQRHQRLYSDTFIHIENATHVLEGTGFESNERLTQYRILHPEGIFPVNRDNLRPGPSGESSRMSTMAADEPVGQIDSPESASSE